MELCFQFQFLFSGSFDPEIFLLQSRHKSHKLHKQCYSEKQKKQILISAVAAEGPFNRINQESIQLTLSLGNQYFFLSSTSHLQMPIDRGPLYVIIRFKTGKRVDVSLVVQTVIQRWGAQTVSQSTGSSSRILVLNTFNLHLEHIKELTSKLLCN